jgi:hypothetical protein
MARSPSLLVALLLTVALAAVLMASPAQAKSRLNLFHAVAGGPNVDIILSQNEDKNTTLYKNLRYKSFTNYLEADPGLYTIIVMNHDENKELLRENRVLINEVDYTITITGLLSDLTRYPLRMISFIDDNDDPEEGVAHLRFIHVAAGSGPMDVILGQEKLFIRVNYGEHGKITGTGYTDVDADEYTLLTLEGGNTFDITNVRFGSGDVQTVFAVGIRGATKTPPDLVTQVTLKGDESSAASLGSWVRLFV